MILSKLEKAKKVYEAITPPMSYSHMVEQAVNGAVPVRKKHVIIDGINLRWLVWLRCLLCVLSCLIPTPDL